MSNEEELFNRCVELERNRYELEDKIEEILDYLLHTHITLEEFTELHQIVKGDDDLSIE